MAAPVLLVVSHWGPPPSTFAPDLQAGRLHAVRQSELAEGDIADAGGLITTMHLDQVDFAARRAEIEALLRAGGRIAFNGHVLRPFLEGLHLYRPLEEPHLPDFGLVRLAPHPIFGELDPASMVLRRGVAGFYGRGHNPLPAGGVALTGIGSQRLPVDWEWRPAIGGAVFSHAGNDLWSLADGTEAVELSARMVAWCAAGRGETGRAA